MRIRSIIKDAWQNCRKNETGHTMILCVAGYGFIRYASSRTFGNVSESLIACQKV